MLLWTIFCKVELPKAIESIEGKQWWCSLTSLVLPLSDCWLLCWGVTFFIFLLCFNFVCSLPSPK